MLPGKVPVNFDFLPLLHPISALQLHSLSQSLPLRRYPPDRHSESLGALWEPDPPPKLRVVPVTVTPVDLLSRRSRQSSDILDPHIQQWDIGVEGKLREIP